MTPTEKADAKTRWKEATSADGRAYYHHLDTKETRWAMPDEMRLAREAALAAEGAAAFASTARPPLSSNGPPNGGLANASAPSASAPSASAPSSSRGKSKSPLDSFGPLDSPSARFASLLFDLDVAPETPWAEVSRRIERSTDPRAAALATAGERKRCFNEYKLKRQKIDREARREAHKRRREAFLASLRAHGDRLGIIPERTKLRDVEKELATDARTKEAFLAVEESRDREELFRRHCEETRERWAEERRERRDAEKRAWLERVKARLGEAFFSFAPAAHDEDEKNDGSNGSPPLWRRARRVDPDPGSDPEAAACERFDRLDAFEREVRAAEAREDADRLREKTAHRKVDREAREAFAATLRELEGEGAISLRVPWRAFVRTRFHHSILARRPLSVMDERPTRRESGAVRSRIKGSTLSCSIQKATSNGKARLMALHRGARQQATLAARSEARLIGRRVRIPCNNDATRCAENCASCRFGVIVSAVNGQCLVDLTSPTSRAAAPAAEISSFNVMKWARDQPPSPTMPGLTSGSSSRASFVPPPGAGSSRLEPAGQ